MRLSDYTIISKMGDADAAVMFNGCTGAIDIVNSNVADVLMDYNLHRSPHINGLSYALKHKLISRGHLVEKANDQRDMVHCLGQRLHKRDLQASGFFLIPTYACQMHCYYCCQQKRWSIDTEGCAQKMSIDMVDAAFLAMRRLNSKGIRSLNLYGGEPFQAENYNLIRHIVELSCREGYLLAAITNGLESKKFESLFGPGKIYGICFSIHGIPQEEEWRRLNANVGSVLSRKAFVAIRINVDPETIKRLDEIFEKAKSYWWFDHQRLFWNICPILPFELPPKFKIIQPEEYEASMLRMLSDEVIPPSVEFDLSAGRQLEGILDRGFPNSIHPRHPSFCGSKQGIFVLDPFGEIFTCHEAVSIPSFSVGRYFPDLYVNQRSLRSQSQWIPESRPDCLSCPFALMCGGGCIHRTTLPPSGKDEFYCRWMKTSMRLALRGYLDKKVQTKRGWL